MFEVVKVALSKHELRYLQKKFKFPDEKIKELDDVYHGKDKLQERIVASFVFWREFNGSLASLDELIRILHIVNMEDLSQKLKAMKLFSQVMKL